MSAIVVLNAGEKNPALEDVFMIDGIQTEGSTRIPYLFRFSRNILIPAMNNMRKAQFMTPSKSWNPDVHENRESLGL